MSSGIRGKESWNYLDQELLNFGDLGSLQFWGWGVGVSCNEDQRQCLDTHSKEDTMAHTRRLVH